MNFFLFSCLHVVCRQFLPKMPLGTNIENIEKTSIYGTFGTEMPHGTLAQVAQTSYMKGEFLCLLFIIMSINFQKRTAKLGIKDIYLLRAEGPKALSPGYNGNRQGALYGQKLSRNFSFFIFVSEKNKINFALCMNYRIFAKDKLRSADIQASLMFSAILQHKP